MDKLAGTAAPRRIGVYGGTFDPIHNAHIAMAQTALAEKQLDRVLVVVSARPPHKALDKPSASAEERYEMVRLALKDRPRLEASRIELDRSGPSYTADTLAAIHAQYPDAQLYLIIGMDSLVDLPKWRQPERILEHARLLVIPRPGDWRIPSVLVGHYEIMPFHETGLSSTDVRQRIHDGGGLDNLAPESVLRYIHERGLYATTP